MKPSVVHEVECRLCGRRFPVWARAGAGRVGWRKAFLDHVRLAHIEVEDLRPESLVLIMHRREP